jgi:hypothetical protein
MATMNLEKALYLDGAKSGGPDAALDGKTSSPPVSPFALMSGDKCPLKVYFRTRDANNGDSTWIDLPALSTLVVAGRTLTGGILFYSSPFVPSGAGTDDSCHSGIIDLTSTAIELALQSTNYGGYIDMFVDVEVADAAGATLLTFRALSRLYRQVYSGSSAQPSVPMLSPSGYLWSLAIDDNGAWSVTRQADPVPLVPGTSFYELLSPSGYVWRFEIEDDGTLKKTRMT